MKNHDRASRRLLPCLLLTVAACVGTTDHLPAEAPHPNPPPVSSALPKPSANALDAWSHCKTKASEIERSFQDVREKPEEQHIADLIAATEQLRLCKSDAGKAVPIEVIQGVLELNRQMLVTWYAADPQQRSEYFYMTGPRKFAPWGRHYRQIAEDLKLDTRPDDPSVDAEKRLAERMLAVDAVTGTFMAHLEAHPVTDPQTRLPSPPEKNDGAQFTQDELKLAEALKNALLAEVDAWEKVDSKSRTLSDKGLPPSVATLAGKKTPVAQSGAVQFNKRIELITTHFASLAKKWEGRSAAEARTCLGEPYYAYVDRIIQGDPRQTATSGGSGQSPPANPTRNADIQISFPVASGQSTKSPSVMRLHDIRREVLAYDDKNLRGFFEMREAFALWQSIFDEAGGAVATNDEGRHQKAVLDLERAVRHTESALVRAVHLVQLTNVLSLRHQGEVLTGKPSAATPDQIERQAKASFAFAGKTITLLNDAMLEPESVPSRPPNCSTRNLNTSIFVGDAGKAYGKLIGALQISWDGNKSFDDIACDLRKLLHRGAFTTFQPELLRYKQIMALLRAEGRVTLEHEPLADVLSTLVHTVHRALGAECLKAGLPGRCSKDDLKKKREVPARPTLEEQTFCEFSALANAALNEAVEVKLHDQARNKFQDMTMKDVELARDEIRRASAGCDENDQKKPRKKK